MNQVRMLLAFVTLVLSQNFIFAQSYCYESPAQWSSAPCHPAAPAPISYGSAGGVWSGYDGVHAVAPAMSYRGNAGCSTSDGYSTWSSPTMACANPNIVEGGYGSTFGDSTLLSPGSIGGSCGGLFGGIEFLWMRANFDQNVAMIVDPPVGNTLVPFDYGFELSPRAWLGWQSCGGTGFRATYFRFDESAGTEAVTAVAGATPVYLFVYGAGGNLSRNANANVGQTLVSNHSLELNSIDLEATQVVRWNQARAIFGLGVRIADMHQTARGDVFNPVGTIEETVRNDLKFQGAGPTASAQLTRGIGASPFGIFAMTRGSFLVSETEQRIYEMKGAFTTELEDIAIQREVLGNLEFGLGVQYGQSIGRSAGMFFRAGYECQLWLDAGGPVDSHSTIGLDGITLAAGVQF
ncbi:hypothetical protein [Rhodopirellula europaea]|uniref:hypothetical protein n=1 Tax=Rhodopirellula europaea TaxID=1263866 RepID=UPI003D2C2DE0